MSRRSPSTPGGDGPDQSSAGEPDDAKGPAGSSGPGDPRSWGKWWEPVADFCDEYQAAARQRDVERRRSVAQSGVPDPALDRAFMRYRRTIEDCRRTVQAAQQEREKVLFFASVSVTAPWNVRRDALIRAERFARHLGALLGSWDHLVHSVEEHEILRRAIRREIRGVARTMPMPSGLQKQFDDARFAVSDAHGRAEGAIRAASSEIRSTRSLTNRAILKKYLWKNSASVLHRRPTLRVIFSTLPLAERLNWLQEVQSCLAETAPERRSRVAIGFVLAAPRTITTAWAMSRRRARAAAVAER